MVGRVNYSGLVVAGVGFLLTRFTVTLAVYDDPLGFYLAGVVPLALGLGLAAFGVALTVADVDSSLVRTTARWCVVGAGAMFVLVVLTLLGSAGGDTTFASPESRTYFSNFLIGGSVGGTLTGLYAAHNRRQRRELTQQANRLEVLNRLLRHEVLNAVTVIKGYASVRHEDTDAAALITDRSDHIAEIIEEVRHLTQSARTDATERTTDPGRWLEAAVSSVRADHPAADIHVEDASLPDDLTVRGTSRLELVFEHLLENAVVHADTGTPTVRVGTAVTPTEVRVSVSDDGPGLPEAQRALLEHGQITEFDDPQDGYGLNVVRLLAESFGADLEV
jgi:signal transduction histidine kinase